MSAPTTTNATSSSNAAPDLAPLYRAHVARNQAGYESALAAAGLDAVVLHAGEVQEVSRFDDREWPFKPSPSFAHWLPLVEPDAWLVVRPGQRPRLIRCRADSFWEAPTAPLPDHVLAHFDTAHARPDALAAELPAGRVAFIGESAAAAARAGIADPARQNPPALTAALDQLRALKTDYERECMAEANRRAARGHKRVFEAFATGPARSELELHLLYLGVTGQDATDAPYQCIVAQNRHAATLHHVHYDRTAPARATRSLLVDAGATHLGYASDVTRTQVRGDDDLARAFGELIARLETLQQEICRRVRPGLPYQDLHDQAHQLLAPILRDLGLIDASDDELVASGATRRFLPHGLGHSLGIQVHDVGCRTTPPRDENPFLRNTTTITPGQVFTIEPGCYFIPALLDQLRSSGVADRVNWPLVDRLSEMGGVRIEDNVAVLEGGTIRNLTREAWHAIPE